MWNNYITGFISVIQVVLQVAMCKELNIKIHLMPPLKYSTHTDILRSWV